MKKDTSIGEYEDPRVKVFIPGKHGRIGIIVPDRKPTEEEWLDLNQAMAEIIYRIHKNAKATDD